MNRDYDIRLDEAAIAAMEGATPEEIEQETGLAPHDIANVIKIEAERRKRREARRGSL